MGKKKAAAALLIAVMVLGNVTTVMAAKDKKITSVSLEVTSNIKIGEDLDNGSIEVDSDSSKYSVDSWEILNYGFEWTEEDTPQIKVYLTAADGYYFSLTASKVKLKGATYVTASKRDSSTTLMITMNLPSLAETVEDLENVTLGEDGIAIWEEAVGAGSYELRVRRDGKNTGSVIHTTGGKCNIRTYLGRPGVYSVRVRPINRIKEEVKGEWIESNAFYVSSEIAAAFRNGEIQDGGRWEEENGLWRYRNADGTYQSAGWKKVQNKWYYFDTNGYMQKGWIEDENKWYYLDDSGAMVSDTDIDGYHLGSDGALVTQQEGE